MSSIWTVAAADGPGKPIDLVFDLDWTLFYPIKVNEGIFTDNKVLRVHDELHRPTDHLAEVIEALITYYPEFRISFFSGSSYERNSRLLEQVKLSDGRSLKDIAFRIFSNSDLTQISSDPQLPKSERYKKDVSNKLPGFDPARTVLIDDNLDFAPEGIKIVHSLGTTTFQSRFNIRARHKEWFPRNPEEWKAERNKALYWLGALDLTLEVARDYNMTFMEALDKVWQQTQDRKALDLLESDRTEYLERRGRDFLQKNGLGISKGSCRMIWKTRFSVAQ